MRLTRSLRAKRWLDVELWDKGITVQIGTDISSDDDGGPASLSYVLSPREAKQLIRELQFLVAPTPEPEE